MKQQRSNISEIDLETMSLRDLIALRDRVDAALAELNSFDLEQYDVRLQYTVSLCTADGESYTNKGNVVLRKFTHPRKLAESPSTFEQTFAAQVTAPVKVDMYDILEQNNPTDNNLNALKQHIGDDGYVAELPAN